MEMDSEKINNIIVITCSLLTSIGMFCLGFLIGQVYRVKQILKDLKSESGKEKIQRELKLKIIK